MKKERLLKLESIVKQLVSEYIFEKIIDIEEDFELINIVWVKISSDLSYLDIYVSCFKNQQNLTKTLATYAPEITGKLHRKLSTKKLPRIRFRYDKSYEISHKITEKINSL